VAQGIGVTALASPRSSRQITPRGDYRRAEANERFERSGGAE
jgi:hypothetical protein